MIFDFSSLIEVSACKKKKETFAPLKVSERSSYAELCFTSKTRVILNEHIILSLNVLIQILISLLNTDLFEIPISST